MVSDSFRTFVSFFSPCTSVTLYFTVILAGIAFFRTKTVGKMSLTFYGLSNYMYSGCVWAFYGLLLSSPTIVVPNLWCVAATSFGLFAYLRVLKAETDAASLAAASSMAELGAVASSGTSPALTPAKDTHNNNNNTSASTIVKIVENGVVVGVVESPVVAKDQPLPMPSTMTTATATAGTTAVNSTATMPLGADTISSTASPFTPSVSTCASPNSGVSCAFPSACVASELSARYTAARKMFLIIMGSNAATLVLIFLCMVFFGNGGNDGDNSSNGEAKTSVAIRVAGISCVLLSGLQFSGPLDQVSWIVKNKNSIPLDPLMTIVGTVNSINWLTFGIITNDVYLAVPMIASVLFCVVQIGLLLKYPRRQVDEWIPCN